MTELQFSLPKNFTGRFVSDGNIEISQKELLLLEAYVPGIEIVSGSPRFDARIEHKESDEQRMVVEGNDITLYGSWDGKLSSDVYHLISGVARQHYLKNNLFPVHAACVGLDDLVLIAGHSGNGKTTVSLELLEKAGMKMYSGNKTVVDLARENPEAVAGTRTMTARTADLKQDVQGVQYGDRTAFKLDDAQYAEAGDIGSVVLVRLNDGVQDWRELSPTSALHRLYPYFLDSVNADVVVGSDVFDGSASQQTKEYLAERLDSALQQVPVYSATGSLPFIVENIAGMKK
jgi:hypothetical protein